MENYAEASCVLKVNIHCHSCKMKIVEVLGSICGEYSFDINTEEGLVKIFALVDPNLLMKALARTGYHAELKWARLQHPKVNRNYSSYGIGGGYSHGGAIDYYPQQHGGYHGHSSYYPPPRALPDPYSSYPSPNYYPAPHDYPTHPYHQGLDPYHSPGMWPNACRRPRPFAASFGGF